MGSFSAIGFSPSSIDGFTRSWTKNPWGISALVDPSFDSSSVVWLSAQNHMMKLQTVELILQFSDLSTIHIHLFVLVVPVFVDLAEDESRITIYHESFDAELHGNV
jgi:hypothetical protein